MHSNQDPFREAREQSGVQITEFNGENIPFVLRLKELRKVVKDWQNFSSDHPFKVVPHSEEKLRSMRQIPIEMDPPDHTDFRALVEPFFKRPTETEYMLDMAEMVHSMVADALSKGEMDAVYEFALPLQCRALARLLHVPESESEVWKGWGLHALTEGSGLEEYTAEQFAKAEKKPGDDFFSMLNGVDFRGRKLTFEEKQGIANVTFAGGKDTVINVVSSIIVYMSEHPEALVFLRQDEKYIMTACEEFVRYVSPLTAISRTCPHAANVGEHEIPGGSRVGLCWPSANRDGSVFKNPDEVVLDRVPNPHIGFGYGIHNCLGAPQARLIIRSLLKALRDQVKRIEMVSFEPRVEKEESYTRQVGYDRVLVKLK
ncbi:MAG: cytochrome P450 [Opitutae bacterium]|nr:cytochrome P450 [Opitutae bacterium]